VLFIFFFTGGEILGLRSNVVSHINILILYLFFELFDILNIFVHLSLHVNLLSLSGMSTVLKNVHFLETLETLSMCPVSEELVHLLSLVEGLHHEFLTPNWSVRESMNIISSIEVLVVYNLLVQSISWPGPDLILIQTVIDGREIGIRRSSIE
jgi:hypothetical protein